MATYRRPKGSYTRHTTDWLISQCMIGGCFYFSSAGTVPVIELFNNAADGSSLHVYRIWSSAGAAGPYWFTRQQGSMGGTVVPSYPVVSQTAPLPGVISYGEVPRQAFPTVGPVAMGAYITFMNFAGDTDSPDADGPICVMAPGDSLRAVNPYSGATGQYMTVTFYWAAIRDTG